VESSHGHLKRRRRPHWLLRGSRDLAAEAASERFWEPVLERGNQSRRESLARARALRPPLPPTRLSEYDEGLGRVGSASPIRVKKVGCSVPARRIGQALKAEVYAREIKLDRGRERWLSLPRQWGARGVVLDDRQGIDPVLRQPGAFEGSRDREPLFPSRSLRAASDHWVAQPGARRGAVESLRLLTRAREVGQSDVEGMLADSLSPPFPAWSGAALRRSWQPRLRAPLELAERQPAGRSSDALLRASQEGAEAR